MMGEKVGTAVVSLYDTVKVSELMIKIVNGLNQS